MSKKIEKTSNIKLVGVIIVFVLFVFFIIITHDYTKTHYSEDQNYETFLNTFQENKSVNMATLFKERYALYLGTIKELSTTLLDVVIITVLGVLLLFYRPKGIDVSFIKLKIPEGVLYSIVIFSMLYLWQHLGLLLNSAIDSRIFLHHAANLLDESANIDVTYFLKRTHLLTDNAIVDNWAGYFYGFFDHQKASDKLWLFQGIGLYGLYGSLFGVFYSVLFVTIIEFGRRKKGAFIISNGILIFALVLMISANYVWVNEHQYAFRFTAYYWGAAAILMLLWLLVGRKLSEKLIKNKVIE